MVSVLQTGSIQDVFTGAELISNVGIMAVISALFIYIFFHLFHKLEKQNTEMFQAMLTQMSNQGKRAEEEHDNKMAVRMQVNQKVNAQLQALLMKLGAERAYIFEFHNGGYNFSGLPFAKFSLTYEITDTTAANVLRDYQNMPLTCLGTLVEDLHKGTPVAYKNISEMAVSNPIFYGFLAAHNVAGYGYIGLKNSAGNVFAMLAVNLHSEKCDTDEYMTTVKTELDNTARAIEALLDVIKSTQM